VSLRSAAQAARSVLFCFTRFNDRLGVGFVFASFFEKEGLCKSARVNSTSHSSRACM